MRTLKVLGFLLTYPSVEQREALAECGEIIRFEKMLSETSISGLETLLDSLESTDLFDLQEEYVNLFDRTPSLSLHLFEHVHGDGRERGQALADLANIYEQAGMTINTAETPDYLPLFLEYLSTLPPQDRTENLNGVVDILSAIGERLKNRSSSYAAIFEALIDNASRKPEVAKVAVALQKESGEVPTFKKMDEEWEEQFAFANPDQGNDSACPKAEDMLARMTPTQKGARK